MRQQSSKQYIYLPLYSTYSTLCFPAVYRTAGLSLPAQIGGRRRGGEKRGSCSQFLVYWLVESWKEKRSCEGLVDLLKKKKLLSLKAKDDVTVIEARESYALCPCSINLFSKKVLHPALSLCSRRLHFASLYCRLLGRICMYTYTTASGVPPGTVVQFHDCITGC